MQRYWYHSPVRFYKNLNELTDKTNPQNCQYFGGINTPYPLQMLEYHRFLIPNYQNEVDTQDLSLWIGDTQIPCRFGIDEGKLFRVSFIYNANISGRLEIKNNEGDTLFHSNCVQFVDSTLHDGRKFIRVATKHLYDRKLFKYSSKYDWIVTNLPAYDLGMFSVSADIKNSRIGGNNTLKTSESHLDEVIKYEVISNGDANILTFLQVHSTNNEFYINGTKRTALEKVDTDDFSTVGKISFVNIKNNEGLNIMIDENEIFNDVMYDVLSNDNKNVAYTTTENKLIPIKDE